MEAQIMFAALQTEKWKIGDVEALAVRYNLYFSPQSQIF